MNRLRTAHLAAFIAVLFVYIAVRFWHVTASCLWFDEIFSVHAAEHSWSSILDFVALDLIHPPLFYVLLKLWIAFGGESLLWLRLLPVLISFLAVVPFVLLSRELKLSSWATIFALFLIAVNGPLIKYAQEVRMYSLLMCLSLFSMWLYLRYLRNGNGTIALSAINVLLVYTHYFGWFVILAEMAIPAWRMMSCVPLFRRDSPAVGWCDNLPRVTATFAIIVVPVLAFLPWIVAVFSTASSGSGLQENIGWMHRPGPRELGTLILNLVEPFYFSVTSIDPESVYVVSLPVLITVIIVLTAFFVGYRTIDDVQKTASKELLIFTIVPLIAIFLASWALPYSIWGTRHLILVFVPFTLLVATSLSNLSSKGLQVGALTIFLLFTGGAFVVEAESSKPQPVWCGFEVLGNELQADGHVPVYVFEDLAAYHLWFTFRTYPDPKMRQRVVKVDGFPGMTEDKAFFIPRGIGDEYLTHGDLPLRTDGTQLWIVYRAPSLDLTKPPLNLLSVQGFKLRRQESFDGGQTKVFALLLEKEP
jgi:hypothetical protein